MVFSGLMLGVLLAALDQTIVATALPTIVGELHGFDQLSWVVTAYLLTDDLVDPLYGKISDLYGRKKIFQVAIVVFLIGSALSGLAQNMDQLIAFRAVQGLGGGGLMALAMAIIGDIVSPRERGKYQGYSAGLRLRQHRRPAGRRLLRGPPQLALDLLHQHPHRDPGSRDHERRPATAAAPAARTPIDYTGAAILVGAVTSLLLVTLWGGQTYAWGSSTIIGLLLFGVVSTVVFIWWERRATEPIFPPHLFANPIASVAFVITFLGGSGDVRRHHLHPDLPAAGRRGLAGALRVLLLPLMGGMSVTSIGSGQVVSRWGRTRSSRWWGPG